MTPTDVITATYRVNTPLFLGGADPEKDIELRLPSFKGALRFWWRALVWQQEDVGDLNKLREKEARLFGSSNQDIGQSKIRMRLIADTPVPLPKETKFNEYYRASQGLSYLGYGVMNFRAELGRPCLPAPFIFDVELRFKRGVEEKTKQEVIRALKLLGLLGSLGSKSRKGYGSLTLLKLSGDTKSWSAPRTAENLSLELQKLKVVGLDLHADEPPYTAFSHSTRIILAAGDHKDKPEELHDRLGRELVRYRAYGRNNQVLNRITAERNFSGDHDLMYNVAHNRDFKINQHPERIAFGLPHNYFFSSTKKGAGVEPQNQNRRASPLFLHVHHVPESPPIGVISFLPAKFLPAHEGVKVNRKTVDLNTADFWKPVTGFLDRMLSEDPDKGRKEPFSKVLEVKNDQ